MSKLNDKKMINDIRCLALDMIHEAGSGHPGIALGAAPLLYTLFTYHINIDLNNFLTEICIAILQRIEPRVMKCTICGRIDSEDIKINPIQPLQGHTVGILINLTIFVV